MNLLWPLGAGSELNVVNLLYIASAIPALSTLGYNIASYDETGTICSYIMRKIADIRHQCSFSPFYTEQQLQANYDYCICQKQS